MISRPSYLSVLILIIGIGIAARPSIAQVVYRMQCENVPVVSYWQFPDPYDGHTIWAAQRGTTASNEQVVRALLTYPRQTTPVMPYVRNPPEYTEFSGRSPAFGRSARHNLQPSERGWFYSGYRMDCLKRWGTLAGEAPPVFWEQYPGEPMQLVTQPGVAHSILVRFSSGIAVAIRHDADSGTPCAAGLDGLTCDNPDCPRFALCEAPWVYPNMPCVACGRPGWDSTVYDFGLYQYTTLNGWFNYEIWNQTTPVESTFEIINAPTVAQLVSANGTPPMEANLAQRVAVSDLTYTAFGRTYPRYTAGLYSERIFDFRIRQNRASFKIEKTLMWSFDTAGLFAFLTAWFDCDPSASIPDGCPGVDTGDIFAFLREWFAAE